MAHNPQLAIETAKGTETSGCCSIQLTQGKYALIDVADFELVSEHDWYASKDSRSRWYARRAVPGGTITMHRFLVGENGLYVDHVNGNGLDNRRLNLRTATNSQNQANRGKTKRNTSGFKGVHFQKTSRKFIAAIQFEGRLRHLGLFTDPIEAAKAYDAAALEYFGQFAKTNFEVRA